MAAPTTLDQVLIAVAGPLVGVVIGSAGTWLWMRRKPAPPIDPDAPVSRDQVVEILRQKKSEFRDRYRIELVGLTGSMARGEDKLYSDVDVVYERAGKTTLFDLGGALSDLQDAFNRKVDLIDFRAISKDAVREEMERDFLPV